MAKSESTKIEFGYFHDYESEQFAFYRIPKVLFTDEGADKILDYYRASKGAFLCIQKNKRILHYGYIIKQSL